MNCYQHIRPLGHHTKGKMITIMIRINDNDIFIILTGIYIAKLHSIISLKLLHCPKNLSVSLRPVVYITYAFVKYIQKHI